MELRKITIDNFLSVGHIEVNLVDMGIVLLEGLNLSDPALKQNGAGKSTILGAVYYAIYGTMPSGKGADSVINRKVGKGTKVELVFEKGGREYTVIRARKKNAVELYCDGQSLTTNSAKNTDELIIQSFGISEKLFTNAILFDSINSKKFATMGDKERKEVLVELLGLEFYNKAHELAKEDLASIEADINKVENDIRTLDVKKDVIIQNVQREREEQEKRSTYLQNATEELENASQALSEYESNYITNGHVGALETNVESLNSQIASLSKDSTSTNQAYAQYISYKQQVDKAEQDINRIRNEFSQLSADKARYETSDTCPTCGNEMDLEHRQLELGKIQDKLQALVEPLQEANNTKGTVAPLVQSSYDEYQALSNKDQEFNQEYQNLSQQVSQLQGQISSINRAHTQHTNAVEGARARVQSYSEELFPRQYSDDLKELSEAREAKVSELAKLVDMKSLTEVAVTTYSDKGVKSHVMDLSVPFLNERIHKYLGTLSGGTIQARLSTQKTLTTGKKSDKIDLVITNEYGADNYESLSAGEKRRVDVSISLALQDLVMTKSELEINVLMYDEVFENLDEVGCENVIALLKERLEVASSILVVSHNESLKPLFNNVMTVVKQDGISSILEGES